MKKTLEEAYNDLKNVQYDQKEYFRKHTINDLKTHQNFRIILITEKD